MTETSGAFFLGGFFGIILGWVFCELYKLEIKRVERNKEWERQALIDALYQKMKEDRREK